MFQKLTGAIAKVGGVAFSAGGKLTGILSGTVTVDPPSIAAAGIASVAATVTGVRAGDIVVLEPPAALEAGLVYRGAVASTDTITILLYNPSAGAVDGASRSWAYRVLRTS